MSDIQALLRTDLRDFAGYRSARSEARDGEIWLNANESPWPNGADADGACRRYPDPQPSALIAALAGLYGCAPEQILLGRGSDEAIDVLIRACCVPGDDAIVVTPPVFGMYAVSARLHGVRVIDVPLRDGARDFEVDLACVADFAIENRAKIVFLCSPGNPAGGAIARRDILGLARALHGHALVAVDEAYVEFADVTSLAPSVAGQTNLVVLRTMSKAHALAAARIGCAIADVALVAALRRCQAPYPVPAPCAAVALAALHPAALRDTGRRIEILREERARVGAALTASAGVRRVY
ncbi:MAG TPA: aminotransferase class I/II-fold pyridoxal phosphate-dependent enzyme, partial [Casimicrobiaceae bacterium]|nr:aminotransferase class I/II-fold pyridoxal phosphate-dependent enzyme [Casimicrobiaceae bacterium]